MKPAEIVDKMYANDAFSKWLGIQILEVKKGYCKLQMRVREEMLNGFKIAHGGVCYSLADSALAFAANTLGKQAVSIETSINHLKKIEKDTIISAEAIQETVNDKLGIYTIKIKQDKDLVAIFKGVVYRTKKEWNY